MILVHLLKDVLLGVIFIAAVVLPAVSMTILQRSIANDEAVLRETGFVVTDPKLLEATGSELGRYAGSPIYEEIVFRGLRYGYDRVAPAEYRTAVRPSELYFGPGIVYRACA